MSLRPFTRISWSILAVAAALLLPLSACKKGDGGAAGGDGGAAGTASSGSASSGKTLLTDANCKADTNKAVSNGRISRCTLTKELTVDGFTCGVDVVVETHADGSFKGCYLKEAKVVDGYSCKDALDLYPGGKLHRCKVTAPKNAGPGIDVRAGDWVTLSKTGSISRLELGSGPNKIHDLTCKGYLNYFYEDGKTKKCELAEDAVIEGKKVPAKADGGSVFVCFDAAGKRVADCKLLTGVVFD